MQAYGEFFFLSLFATHDVLLIVLVNGYFILFAIIASSSSDSLMSYATLPYQCQNDSIGFLCRELIEWVEYMRYGGVGRFLLYDCTDVAVSQPLVQHPEIIPYLREGYVKITPWNVSAFGRFASATSVGSVAAIAADAHLRFGKFASVWRTVLDAIEYVMP